MPVSLGTPLTPSAKKVLFCGSGELGKEVAIELQRLGVEVIAVDRYANAPAMQVAHRSHVINMLDGAALRAVIEAEKPDLIVPEIEAIATDTLAELESEGFTVIPTAKATQLTMNREGIRRLAAEELDEQRRNDAAGAGLLHAGGSHPPCTGFISPATLCPASVRRDASGRRRPRRP